MKSILNVSFYWVPYQSTQKKNIKLTKKINKNKNDEKKPQNE